MFYKTPGLATELPFANPEIRSLAHDLDEQHHKWGLPGVTLTAVLRDPSFYPDKHFSWHFCGNALDIRTRDHTTEDRARVVAWIQGWCFAKELKWDIVLEIDHLHVEVEDADWLRKWEQRTGQNFGRGNA